MMLQVLAYIAFVCALAVGVVQLKWKELQKRCTTAGGYDFDALGGHRLPAKSQLASFTWQAAREISSTEMDTFGRDGYIVLSSAVNAAAIDLMREEAERQCAHQMRLKSGCHLEDTFRQIDIIRDFVFFGPLGKLVNSFIPGPGVRLKQDGIYGHRHVHSEPKMLSFVPHVEGMNKLPGIFDGLHSESVGVSVWLPLQDVDSEKQGGSIRLVKGYPKLAEGMCPVLAGYHVHKVIGLNSSELAHTCGLEQLAPHVVEPSFRKGDVLVHHPLMMRASQTIVKEGFTRYAWTGRFAAGDSVHCMSKCMPFQDGQGTSCCKHGLKAGDAIQTPCFPQVFPHVLEEEFKIHMAPKTAPLAYCPTQLEFANMAWNYYTQGAEWGAFLEGEGYSPKCSGGFYWRDSSIFYR